MNRRKKILAGCGVFLVVILLAAGGGLMMVWPILKVGTAFKSKNLCSSVFLSGRDAKWVEEEDLSFGPLAIISGSVDMKNKSASSTVFGLAGGTSIFREGLGCTIVSETTEAELHKQVEGFVLQAKPNISNIAWPQGDLLPTDPAPALTNPAKLDEALQYAFDEPDSSNERRTRAALVIHNGRIIAEQYSKGITQDTPLGGYSMTKSVTNALVGILVKQGKLDVMQPAPVPEWKGARDPRQKITLDQLMRMSSGLDFNEDYDDFTSDVVTMLYRKANAGAFAANKSLRADPDGEWYYSSGTTNIISRIVRDTLEVDVLQVWSHGDIPYNIENYWNFPRKELFEKIGMHTTTMEPDAYGTFVGSSFMYATARDWARFGMLYLNDGVWNGERILPEGWVKYSTTPTPKAPKGEYGAQFWLNAGAPENPADRELKDVPRDAYMMSGYEGQSVIIIPSRQLVIVRLGQSRPYGAFDRNLFTALILEAIGQPKKTDE